MRKTKPDWIPIQLIDDCGLKQRFICLTCGTRCERQEEPHSHPKGCINLDKLSRFKALLNILTPSGA